MATERSLLTVGGVPITVVRKAIKNVHLGVYPPEGRVRVAAPPSVSDEAVRLAVVGRLAWIKRARAAYQAQDRQTTREMVAGEAHWFLGRCYRLRLVDFAGAPLLAALPSGHLELHIRRDSDSAARARAIALWYRAQLRDVVAPLVERWAALLGVEVPHIAIRRMKTRWGTCSSSRVTFNSELAKKPRRCIEYVVVHELVHLLERSHGPRFIARMDRHLPRWRALRRELNDAPLPDEDWTTRRKGTA